MFVGCSPSPPRQKPLQLQPHRVFGCGRHYGACCLCDACFVVAATAVLLVRTIKHPHATQLCGGRSNSGVRCKPSSCLSAACGSAPEEATPIWCCSRTLLLLRGASGGPGLLVSPARSKCKATRTDVHLMIHPAPFMLAIQA